MPFYDEFYDRPISRWGKVASERSNMAILQNFLRTTKASPENLDLLEIGCGRGYIGLASKILKFRSFTGVEPNQRLAQYCRDLLDVDIYEELLPNLTSLANDSFDVVMSAHVLEHSTNPIEAREWCEEMYRIVRPGGHVLIVCPDAIDYKIYFWDSDWSHGYPPTPKRVSQIFTDIGLETVLSGKMHLGRLGLGSAFLAHSISGVIPTQLGDALTARIFGRPLVSGLKLSLWGLVFAVGKKPEEVLA